MNSVAVRIPITHFKYRLLTIMQQHKEHHYASSQQQVQWFEAQILTIADKWREQIGSTSHQRMGKRHTQPLSTHSTQRQILFWTSGRVDIKTRTIHRIPGGVSVVRQNTGRERAVVGSNANGTVQGLALLDQGGEKLAPTNPPSV